MTSLRARVAVAGAAESDLGAAAPGMRPVDLMTQASIRALDDCGLRPGDVDGLFATSTQLPMAPLNLGQELGIRPRYTDATNVGGSSFMFHVNHARAAIAAGLCEVALIAYGSTQRLVGRAQASVQELDPWETPYGPRMPVTAYALAASRHMHEFGTTREQLAEVAVSARRWAQRNPAAWSREELSIDDVLSSRMIADPLTLHDCCLVTDGGAAIVVTSAQRAATLRRPPVLVLGAGEAHRHRHVTGMGDLTRTAAVESGATAFAEARPDTGRRRLRPALRRVHDHADPVPRGPRLLRQGRGRAVRQRRPYGSGGCAAHEHERRRTVLLPSRDVRPSGNRGGCAATPRRGGRAPSAQLPDRGRTRQWGRLVQPGHIASGDR